jgi:uncharacterized protein
MLRSEVGSRRVNRAAVLSTIAALAALAAAAPAGAAMVARGSAEQVDVTGVTAGAKLTLIAKHGRIVSRVRAGSLGGAIFRNVKPGSGYRVAGLHGASKPVTVFSNRSAPPSTKIYDQTIPTSGYGYVTMRDGTQLALDVHLPQGATPGGGPYPTVVEYAGYGYADPFSGPDSGIAMIANLFGFAVVDVNMRGTGCSGGAYDYFEPLQGLDGYDVIETVARQPWVLHHKVGMIGVSYGGISQLFVAETRPPSLSAITPLSVIDDSTTTLYAGGILNTGFTIPWIKDRVNDSLPATATTGQPWALKEIQKGDQTCKANQALHPQAVNLLAKVAANRYYVPKVADPLSPVTFVNKIDVPVYLACQFTDEQTGGHCPDIAEHFTGTTHKWFTFTNGVHTDSLDPQTFNRWYDFLELYVAQQQPKVPAFAPLAGALYQSVLGVPGVILPPDPIQSSPDYQTALNTFQALPQVRILFDNGAGGTAPGQPLPGFEQSFAKFPLPGTAAQSWYLDAGGALAAGKPSSGGADKFTWNPHALPMTDFSGDTGGGAGGLWNATPAYHWNNNPAGTAASYLTPPLAQNTTIVGGGAVDAWIKAPVSDVDLQVTVSEVRPDGLETFVQDGWLRASDRVLNAKRSTLLAPILSTTKQDVKPLPKNTFTEVTIPLYYEGHVYRAGSRIRITIAAPNGAQPIWAFSQTLPKGTTTVTIAHGGSMPSRLILPVVSGVNVPTPLPPCPGLRGEPCRPYVALTNTPG